jgi:hypothetical protein
VRSLNFWARSAEVSRKCFQFTFSKDHSLSESSCFCPIVIAGRVPNADCQSARIFNGLENFVALCFASARETGSGWNTKAFTFETASNVALKLQSSQLFPQAAAPPDFSFVVL